MRIGLDFGTTYSKITFLDAEDRLQVFSYPGELGRRSIPTAVAYYTAPGSVPAMAIGEAARERAGQPSIDYCEGFKLLLPLPDAASWTRAGWRSMRSPTEVTTDYLRHLLLGDRQSLVRMYGPIDSLVLSVPQLWQSKGQNHGAQVLEGIVTSLGLPLDHLRSEPVCAAAYYATRYLELEGQPDRASGFDGALLICDVGGGTFDVTVCRIQGRKPIKVIDFDGSGESGTGLAGLAFDRDAVRRAFVRRHAGDGVLREPDLLDSHGHPLDPLGAELLDRLLSRPAFLRLLRDFERVKINEHDKFEDELLAYGSNPLLVDTPAYILDSYEVTFADIKEAFAPIEAGILSVLSRVRRRLEAGGYDPLTLRLAIVGSFGQFPHTRHAILQALDIAETGDLRYDARLNSQNMAYAVAYGAALIANGRAEVEEPYPHTIGITLHEVVDGRLRKIFNPIVAAGQQVGGSDKPIFMQDTGARPEVIEVFEGAGGSLPVNIILRGQGAPAAIEVPVTQFPPPGKYHVGLLLNRSNLARLIFRPVETLGPDYQYDLGDLEIKLVRSLTP